MPPKDAARDKLSLSAVSDQVDDQL